MPRAPGPTTPWGEPAIGGSNQPLAGETPDWRTALDAAGCAAGWSGSRPGPLDTQPKGRPVGAMSLRWAASDPPRTRRTRTSRARGGSAAASARPALRVGAPTSASTTDPSSYLPRLRRDGSGVEVMPPWGLSSGPRLARGAATQTASPASPRASRSDYHVEEERIRAVGEADRERQHDRREDIDVSAQERRDLHDPGRPVRSHGQHGGGTAEHGRSPSRPCNRSRARADPR